MHRLTRYAWMDFLFGLAGALALTAALSISAAAWYLEHLGSDAPVLWDGYGVWFGALALSLALAVRLRDRCPVFAGAMLGGACAVSLLLLVALWLLDNSVGFSA